MLELSPREIIQASHTTLPATSEDVKDRLAQVAADMLGRLRRHGGGPGGSVTRLAYSPEWEEAMAEIEGWFGDYGLETKVDAVGSRFGKLNGDTPEVVLTGSHIDSVIRGGAYDGALGVIMAICAVGWLGRAYGCPRRTLEVFANCEEESSRFPGNFWGARAMLGLIPTDEPDRLADVEDITIAEAMERCGLDAGRISEAKRSDIAAFIEPHIEQGPLLDASDAQVGVVDRVVGVRQLEFHFVGSCDHAGTTPMGSRRDPLVAAAELVTRAKELAFHADNGAVATVGSLTVRPGGANQIPGEVQMTIDFRHPEDSILDDMEQQLEDAGKAVSARHSVLLSTKARLSQRPIEFDIALRETMERSCEEAGCRWIRVSSGAGHDAQLVARRFPTAMLFVPSKGGRSHRPDEETDIKAVVAGIDVLMRTLYQLAY